MKKPARQPVEYDGPPDIQFATITHQGVIIREPLVISDTWRDPTDTSSQAQRHGAKMVKGARVAWQIERLHRSSPREITEAHVKAATHYMRDFDMGVQGATGSGWAEAVDGGSNDGYSAARIEALTAHRLANASLGNSGVHIITMVIVNNATITKLATNLKTNNHRAMGRFIATMDRLRDHYDAQKPPKQTRAKPQTDQAIVDASITDIPQVQLGRFLRA